MEIWQIILLTFVGMLSGWLNVMAGGGSLLSVPVMLFMDIPAPVANGTNRIAILAQNITAVYTFFRKGFSDFKLSLSLSLAACLGAVGGAWLGVIGLGGWPFVAGWVVARLADITKWPPGVGAAERLPGAWGVMADDLVAGLYGLAAGWLIASL